jgi:hypothetical protein
LLHFNVNIISHETAAMKAVSRVSEEPNYLAEELIQLQSLSCHYEVYVFMHKKIPLESNECMYKGDRTRRPIYLQGKGWKTLLMGTMVVCCQWQILPLSLGSLADL